MQTSFSLAEYPLGGKRNQGAGYPPAMSDLLRVAAVQLTSGADKAANLEKAGALVAQAAGLGAELIVLPEKWNLIGAAQTLHAGAEPLDGGESVEALREWARTYGVAIVGGSIVERRDGREKLSNTSLLVDREGEVAAVYRKIHLFDVDVAGQRYRESDAEEPGDEAVAGSVAGWEIGLTVCYDLRFPELFRVLALEGAEVITVPANFTLMTGRDHWHVLLRARAIENQLYVIAPGQLGEPVPGKRSYGRSLIVDPWGVVVAQAPDAETVVVAELDRARLIEIRRTLPSLASRRPEAYGAPARR
jgi:predicted amidohydrolase